MKDKIYNLYGLLLRNKYFSIKYIFLLYPEPITREFKFFLIDSPIFALKLTSNPCIFLKYCVH